MAIRYAPAPDIPGPILNAILDPYYDRDMRNHWDSLPDDLRERYQDNHFSATTLPRAPRQRVLTGRHSDKVLVDPKEAMWRLFGHIAHAILERHPEPGDVVEERLGVDLDGCYVHGQCDRHIPDEKHLQDYKVGKAAAMLYDSRIEHIAQLNILAWIWRHNGHEIVKLSVAHLFRDHEGRNVKEGSRYPESPIEVTEIPVWTQKECHTYIVNRMRMHQDAGRLKDDDLPSCTDDERWFSPPIYKVYKLNTDGTPQEKAKHTAGTQVGAEDWVDRYVVELCEAWTARERKRISKLKTERGDHTIKKFPIPKFTIFEWKGKPNKCCNYCDISGFCNQHRQWEKEQEILQENASE